MTSNRWLLILSSIAFIVFVCLLIYGILGAPHGTQQGTEKEGKPIIPTYILTIATLIFILGIIPLFYYFIHKNLENKFERTLKIISDVITDEKKESSETNQPVNCAHVIQNFLSYNEKKVINKLIEQKGTALQSEISRIESLGKVKTHRAVQDLERKGIISIERYGNTNRLNLSNDLKKIFLK